MIKLLPHLLFSPGLWTINNPLAFSGLCSHPVTLLLWTAGPTPHLMGGQQQSKHSIPGSEFFSKRIEIQLHPTQKEAPRTQPWWILLNIFLEQKALSQVDAVSLPPALPSLVPTHCIQLLRGKMRFSRSKCTWIWTPSLPCTSYVFLGKLFNLCILIPFSTKWVITTVLSPEGCVRTKGNNPH